MIDAVEAMFVTGREEGKLVFTMTPTPTPTPGAMFVKGQKHQTSRQP